MVTPRCAVATVAPPRTSRIAPQYYLSISDDEVLSPAAIPYQITNQVFRLPLPDLHSLLAAIF